MTRPSVTAHRFTHRAGRSATLFVLLSSLLLNSCTDSPSSPDPTAQDLAPATYEPPEKVRHATMIWSADSEVDLFGPQAILIRGAREADIVAAYGGPNNTYPGFMNALDPDLHVFYMQGSTAPSIVGTEYARIHSIDERPDGFTALVCVQNSGMATYNEGVYTTSNAPAYMRMFEFTNTALVDPERASTETDSSTTPLPDDTSNQRQPTADQLTWSAPTNNLFTGWTISLPPPPGETDEWCDPWGRIISPDAPSEPETIRSESPPPTLPAYPGWPRDV